jgi:hypothetical protein
MALLIAVSARLLLGRTRLLLTRSGPRLRSRPWMRRRAVRRNVSPANAVRTAALSAAILRRRWNHKQHEREENTEQVFHLHLLVVDWQATEKAE